MELLNLTEHLVKALVNNPDSVRVKEFATEEDNFMLIQVMVDENDMGKVIGKNGKVANSIRTVVQASARSQHLSVKINIDSF